MGREGISRREAVTGGAALGVQNVPQYRDVALTNAQMLALRATPITLAAAPGKATVFRQFLYATLVITTSAGAYTETADNLVIRQTDGSGVILSDTIETTGFIDGTAIKMTTARAKLDPIGALLNKALVLHNSGDGEFGGGNAANSLRVRCYFLDLLLVGWNTPA